MAHRNLVLAGDIGGTKTNLALFSVHGDKLHAESSALFPASGTPVLCPVLQEFLAGGDHAIDAACFGIAGPVVDGKVKTPNLPWMIDTAELRRGAEARCGRLAQRSRSRRLRHFYPGATTNSARLTKARCASRVTRR